MNSRHRTIRTQLSSTGTLRAMDWLKAFHLPEREATCIIEKEINGLSCQQICDKYHLTPETVKEARRRGFSKIADDIKYKEEKARG